MADPLLIDNLRVSESPWNAEAEAALRGAIRDQDAGIGQETFAYLDDQGDGQLAHHEVRNGVLILNRAALYQANAEAIGWENGEKHKRIPLPKRIAAREHLRRHFRALEDVIAGE